MRLPIGRYPVIKTIAIIDDDAEVRSALDNLMRSSGFAVQAFESAEAFLASDAPNAAACVITDVRMSSMSGIDLQNILSRRGSRLPVVFVTAFRDERTRRIAEAQGCAGFFSKPFDAAMLLKCVHDAVESTA